VVAPLPCPKKCGKAPDVSGDGYGVIVHCPDHYDADCGAEVFFTTSLQGVCTSRDGAVKAWNEAVEDWTAEHMEAK
jgi:hypothetical protein